VAYVIIASIFAVIVSLVYLGCIWKSFREVSRVLQEAEAGGGSAQPAASISATASSASNAAAFSAPETESWFSWKALISIVASSAILFIAGRSAFFWNLIPFVAIGSAVAVIVAFSIDFRKKDRSNKTD